MPGADEAYSIDTVLEAIAFDRRLAEIARNPVAPMVVILGAGFTGRRLGLLPSRLLSQSASRRHVRILQINELDFRMVIWLIVGEVSSGAETLIETFRDALVTRLNTTRARLKK